jgi:hypothetical protein
MQNVIPTPTSRLRARISGVMQSPAISSLIRKSQSATLPGVPRVALGHDTTRLATLSTARSALTNRKDL